MIIKKALNYISRNIYYHKIRNGVRKDNFTIFANDCCGGVIYHQLGKEFCSPFINLFVNFSDFIKFCKNPDSYLVGELTELPDAARNYPVGKLLSRDKGDFIRLDFMHYKCFKEAKQKWNERIKRLTGNNYFCFDLTNCTKEQTICHINEIEKIKLKNYFIIVRKDFNVSGSNVFEINFFGKQFQLAMVLQSNKKPWIKYIDQIDYKKIFH